MLLPLIMAAGWFEAPIWCVMVLLIVGPLILLHLVWTVLHDTEHPVADLPPEHEWDYLDRPDLAARS